MKILHINPSMNGGGIKAMMLALANEMVKTEDVTVCSIFEPNLNDAFYQNLSANVKVETCHKTKEGFSLKELIKVYRVVRRGHYDVVNMHGFMYYYILTVVLSVFTKTKFFYTVHSDAKMENTLWDSRLLWIKRALFKHKLVHPITISDASRESFTRLYHCESQLIYNGITPPDLTAIKEDITLPHRKTKDTTVFVHAGRISPPKNQLVLCKVFQRLIDEGNDVVLLIAGAMQDKKIYADIEPYFGERIVYLGERSDAPLIMAQCDAMCLPSIWEGLPITLLESLAVGCPPLCAPVGGIVNIVSDGENGMLSASSSVDDYYNTIKRFLALDTVERQQLQERCKASFAPYNIKTKSQEYLNYYRSML